MQILFPSPSLSPFSSYTVSLSLSLSIYIYIYIYIYISLSPLPYKLSRDELHSTAVICWGAWPRSQWGRAPANLLPTWWNRLCEDPTWETVWLCPVHPQVQSLCLLSSYNSSFSTNSNTSSHSVQFSLKSSFNVFHFPGAVLKKHFKS